MLATAALCVCVTTVAASGSGQEVFQRIRDYEFGQNTEALQAVKKQVYGSLEDKEQREELARRLAGLLQSDASFACKQFVCRQLALIGTAEQVPALSELLADDKLSHSALYAFVHIDSPSVDRALRRSLDHTAGRTRVGIINCLGHRRDKKSVDTLGELLRSKDAQVARASAAALAQIGGDEARTELLESLRAGVGPRNAVADACMECAGRLAEHGQRQEAASIYRRIYELGHPSPIRAAALKGLSECLPAEKATSMLVEAISGEESALRDAAGWQLRQIGGEEVTTALAEQISELSPSAKVVVLSALGDRGDPAALPAVRKACESGNESVRLAAIEALGKLGGASEVRFLAKKAAGASGEEAQVARQSLSSLSGSDVNGKMVELVSEVEPDAGVELINGLAARAATEVTGDILQLTKADNAGLRRAAFRALSDLADEDDLPEVLDLVEQAEASDRTAAESAVMSVVRRSEEQPVDTIIRRYRSADDTELRRSWMRILAGLGGERALETLRQALKGDSPEIRITAIRMLSEWQTPAPRADLLEVAGDTDNPKERTLALRGFVRLVGIDDGLSQEKAAELYLRASELATRPAEKRMILSGVSGVNSPAALELIEVYLDDAAVRDEAALAAVQIAQQIWGSYPERCREAMEKVLDVAESERVKDQARQVLRAMETMNGYITAWQVAGPYMKDGANERELFDMAFAPEKEGKEADWRIMPVSGGPPVILNLMSIGGGDNRVAYLCTRVWSAKKRPARLEIGSDDGIKVWLNDEVVHANNTNRGCQPGQDKADVTLQKGWNSLMMKVTQGAGGWAACARVTAPDGSLMDGIRFGVPEK